MKKVFTLKSKKKKKSKAKTQKRPAHSFKAKKERAEPARSDTPETASSRFTGEDRALIARLAVDVWRMQKREETWVRQIVERFVDNLRELDVEIIDLTGEPFFAGDTIEVLDNEAPDGWTGDLIVARAVRPTIRVGDWKAYGQVVIGISDPAAKEATCLEK